MYSITLWFQRRLALSPGPHLFSSSATGLGALGLTAWRRRHQRKCPRAQPIASRLSGGRHRGDAATGRGVKRQGSGRSGSCSTSRNRVSSLKTALCGAGQIDRSPAGRCTKAGWKSFQAGSRTTSRGATHGLRGFLFERDPVPGLLRSISSRKIR